MENLPRHLNFKKIISEEIEKDLDRLVFNKNQTIYMAGSTPLGVYILQQGSILISKNGSQ